MILRVKFTKKNYLRYISHLDLMRLFQRNFRRAGIPIKYSEGFNPHPKFSIANPLSLGIESEEEYMDIDLKTKMSVEDFKEKMNKVLPKDVQILESVYLKKGESISSLISWAFYEINFDINKDLDKLTLENIIEEWLNLDEIIITRLRKKGKNRVEKDEDIKTHIGNIVIKKLEDNNTTIDVLLRSGDKGNLKPMDFMEALNKYSSINIDMDSVMIKRLGLYAENNNKIYKPL